MKNDKDLRNARYSRAEMTFDLLRSLTPIIMIFISRSTDEFKYSRLACYQLIDNIKSQTVEYVFDSAKANQTCDQILKAKKDTFQDIELNVREKLDIEQVRAMDIAQMKGASS